MTFSHQDVPPCQWFSRLAVFLDRRSASRLRFCFRMLGSALLGQKEYADAEPLLMKGYEGMKQREKSIPKSGGGDKRIPEALDGLIELYTATNKPEEVKKWQAERAKYPPASAVK